MKKSLLISALLLISSTSMSEAQKTKSQLTTEINANLPSGQTGAITAQILRTTLLDMVSSWMDLNGSGSFGCATSQKVIGFMSLSQPNCAVVQPSDVGIITPLTSGNVLAGGASNTLVDSGTALSSLLVAPSSTAGDLIAAGPGANQIQDTSALSFANLPTNLTMAGGVVMSGVSSSTTSKFFWSGPITGTCSGGAICGAFHIQSPNFQVNGTANGPYLLNTIAIAGNSGMLGGAGTLSATFRLNHTSGNVSGASYTAGNFVVNSNISDNGTAGTPLSALHGVSNACSLFSGATNWASVNCMENDVDLETGSSVRQTSGVAVIVAPTSTQVPTKHGVAFQIGASLGATGLFDCGYCFGNFDSHVELAFQSGGSLMAVLSNQDVGTALAVTNGIHLNTNVTFSGNAFDSPGFSVSGTGNVTSLALGVTGSTCFGTGWAQTATNGLGICSNGTEIGRITSGNQLFLGTTAAIAPGDQLALLSTTSGDRNLSFRNASANSAARGVIYLGNNTSATEVSMILNSSSNSAGNGTNSFTITSAGNMFLQGGSTNALEVTSSGVVVLPAVATGTPVASLCIDASNNIIKKTTTGSCI